VNSATQIEIRTAHSLIQKEQSQVSVQQLKMEKALEKGYKMDKIYEVWHFQHNSTELWKENVRKFLKIKLEISKFTCSEDEYRQKARRFGIELE